jgi:hypothetical protein
MYIVDGGTGTTKHCITGAPRHAPFSPSFEYGYKSFKDRQGYCLYAALLRNVGSIGEPETRFEGR